MSSYRTQEACRRSVERDGFSADIAPLIEALRKQWEAEDELLLAMHPAHPAQRGR